MKSRLIKLIFTFLLFILIFQLQKPAFMAYYHTLFAGCTAADWFAVLRHALQLDMSVAGYMTAIPALLTIASLWAPARAMRWASRTYFAVVSLLLSVIFVLDMALYEYWGFRLDCTPFFYFATSPADAIASVSIWMVLGGVLIMLLYAAVLFVVFDLLWRRPDPVIEPKKTPMRALVLLVMAGLLFIPIRGGLDVSTMNLGRVYFSSNQRLNHAAINPAFSLLDSYVRQVDFGKQYRFMSDDEADALFAEMSEQPATDSIPQLLNTKRPNVVIVVMESFSCHIMETFGGERGVTPRLDELAGEGILFTDFYANSFRTDRGLTAVLSGYPAQPTTSIMKYTEKVQNLPSIPRSLKREGYHPYYYYGGDANFTNMRGYLTSMGIEDIVSQDDFPKSVPRGDWGVADDALFRMLGDDVAAGKLEQPFVTVVQTSSSHEPFKVPYSRLKDERLNSLAFADSCIGRFVDELKQTELWQNTVVVLVPDHVGTYPKDLDNPAVWRYHIPLILTGGAITGPQRIATRGMQIDIAATLLWQLGISADEFIFSRNILNPASPHFAFFTMPNFFGVITDEGHVVFDCETNTPMEGYCDGNDHMFSMGKAFIQKLYDDIASR
jgi:phosphoglycerol transferase MdoB-like AlkP superfamily enzyme